MKIPTKDANGNPNGYLVPLWNCHEQDWRPDQVYLTVVEPGCSKGPHLHKKRTGRFVCVKGNVTIITMRGQSLRLDPDDASARKWIGKYERHWSGPGNFRLIEVPPGIPAQLINYGDEPAFVINMPTPAWTPDDQDEWPVEDWSPPFLQETPADGVNPLHSHSSDLCKESAGALLSDGIDD